MIYIYISIYDKCTYITPMSLWFGVDLSILFLWLINHRSHHLKGAPPCSRARAGPMDPQVWKSYQQVTTGTMRHMAYLHELSWLIGVEFWWTYGICIWVIWVIAVELWRIMHLNVYESDRLVPDMIHDSHGVLRRDDLRSRPRSLRLHRGSQGAAGSPGSSAAGDGESLEGRCLCWFFSEKPGRGNHGETHLFIGVAHLPNTLKWF